MLSCLKAKCVQFQGPTSLSLGGCCQGSLVLQCCIVHSFATCELEATKIGGKVFGTVERQLAQRWCGSSSVKDWQSQGAPSGRPCLSTQG